jgi:hypothetical protein
MPDTTESARCAHRRVTHGHGAVYECLDCEATVPPEHMGAMQAAEVTPDAFGFLASHYALPVDEAVPQLCAHLRVTRQTHQFHQRGPAPIVAHQCLGCGDPVRVEDVARRQARAVLTDTQPTA